MRAIAVAAHFNVLEHLAQNPFQGWPRVSSFLLVALSESGIALSKQVAACPTEGMTPSAKARSMNVAGSRRPGAGRNVGPADLWTPALDGLLRRIRDEFGSHMVGCGAVDRLTRTLVNK